MEQVQAKSQDSLPRWELLSAMGLIVAGVASRFLPHGVNVSPILGLAIFIGHLSRRNSFLLAFMVIMMVISDLAIGFYEGISMVYLAYVVAFAAGAVIRRRGVTTLLISGLSSSVIFFFLSNFGVWMWSGMYERTSAGLFQCYIMALPFFPNSVFSTLGTLAVTFGLFSLTERLVLVKSH